MIKNMSLNEFEAIVKAGNFVMPKDRFLNYNESKILKKHQLEFTWVKCKKCSALGATTNSDSEFCSLKCYNEMALFDPKKIQDAMDLVKQNNYAQPGDHVLQDGKKMFVYKTDCNNERLRKPYKMTFSYVMIYEGEKLIAKDLEEPLKKIPMT